MKIIKTILKAVLKLTGLTVIGAIALAFINLQVFPTASSDLFAWIFLLYMVLTLLFVLKPSIFSRKSAKPPENTGSSAETKPIQIKENKDDKNEFVEVVHSEALMQSKQVSPAETVSTDFQPLLSQLGRDEKFVTMVGLLALYGDGEFSEPEITKFREIISNIDFSPPSLIHRDPTDENLCLDEKVAWALNFIRDNFKSSKDFNEEDIFDLFEQLTKSIDKDLDNDFSDAGLRKEYSNNLKQALVDIAEADGEQSENERKLLNAFKKASPYHNPIYFLTGLGFVCAVVYALYKFITYLF